MVVSIRPLSLYLTVLTFGDLVEECFKNIMGKGENAGNQYYLLNPLPNKPLFLCVCRTSL